MVGTLLYLRQVVSAVDFLHTRSILHRDIKDENIIIDHRFGKLAFTIELVGLCN